MALYRNRSDAGRTLAGLVTARGFSAPVVLALPRGGVPVAVEIATAIRAPVDLIMVRKLGLPSQPELAAGAIVNGDDPYPAPRAAAALLRFEQPCDRQAQS